MELILKEPRSLLTERHTFCISKEYKEKIERLSDLGIDIGPSFRPLLYRHIDEKLAEAVKLRSK